MKFWVYLLRCSNGAYYLGHTDNVSRRLKEHNAGCGAEYTKKYRPVGLVFKEPFESESAAIKREKQIKRWSHAKKTALINGDIRTLRSLAKRRK